MNGESSSTPTVVVSRLLAPSSVPARAVDKALKDRVLVLEATIRELAGVLSRPKFDPYVTRDERERFFALFVASPSRSPYITGCKPAATRRTT